MWGVLLLCGMCTMTPRSGCAGVGGSRDGCGTAACVLVAWVLRPVFLPAGDRTYKNGEGVSAASPWQGDQ